MNSGNEHSFNSRAAAKPKLSRAKPATSKTDTAPRVFIALGSNLGDSVEILRRAVERLETFSAQLLQRSSLWKSEPVDCPPGSPPFLNAVVGLVPLPGETPESMLRILKRLEREFGRRPRKIVNEPRPLDLDLIAFEHFTRSSSRLVLPHPRARGRRFVLEPLCELAPGLVLPGETKSVAELLAGLPLRPKACKVTD